MNFFSSQTSPNISKTGIKAFKKFTTSCHLASYRVALHERNLLAYRAKGVPSKNTITSRMRRSSKLNKASNCFSSDMNSGQYSIDSCTSLNKLSTMWQRPGIPKHRGMSSGSTSPSSLESSKSQMSSPSPAKAVACGLREEHADSRIHCRHRQ